MPKRRTLNNVIIRKIPGDIIKYDEAHNVAEREPAQPRRPAKAVGRKRLMLMAARRRRMSFLVRPKACRARGMSG